MSLVKKDNNLLTDSDIQVVINSIGDVMLAERIENALSEYKLMQDAVKENSDIDSDFSEAIKDYVKDFCEKKNPAYVDLNQHKDIVKAALYESYQKELLGSMGNVEAGGLYYRLKYEDYCIAHGTTYEQMDDLDYEQYELERMRDYYYEEEY